MLPILGFIVIFCGVVVFECSLFGISKDLCVVRLEIRRVLASKDEIIVTCEGLESLSFEWTFQTYCDCLIY